MADANSVPILRRIAVAEWGTAPHRTEWGGGMLEATVELSKDETLTLYADAEGVRLLQDLLRATQTEASS